MQDLVDANDCRSLLEVGRPVVQSRCVCWAGHAAGHAL